ncbi:MAG: hypothetical protein JJE30_03665 [Desulfuromonadales bacterium]|nr:hypothetical protein [Desulfuromonadales bacterium]
MFPLCSDADSNKSHYIGTVGCLILLLLIAAITRIPFMINGFGEPDSARILITAIDSSKYNVLNEYQIDVVPGYAAMLAYLLKTNGSNYSAVLNAMNLINVIIGIAIVIPGFYYLKSITKDIVISFYAILMFLFAPAIWQASLYGFPTLISLFFLITSLWFFTLFYDVESNLKYVYIVLSLFCIVFLFIIKADILLNLGAFIGTALIKKYDRKNILFVLVYIAIAFISCLLVRKIFFGVSGSAQTGSIAGIWSFITLFKRLSGQSWYITHIKPILYATGFMTCVLFVFGIVTNYIHNRRYLLLCICWVVPPTIFWSLLSENSTRHNMASVLPEVLLVVIFISYIFNKTVRYKMALILVVVSMLITSNILLSKPSSDFVSPSANIFKSSKLYSEQSNRFAENVKDIFNGQQRKICFMGGWENPFVIFEILNNSQSYKVERLKESDHYRIEMTAKDGKDYTWVVIYPRGATKEEAVRSALEKYKDYDFSDYLIVTSLSGLGIETEKL